MDADQQQAGGWLEPSPDRRCTATSKQTGNRCRRYREPGATVCRVHGGAAPQVRKKAALRLLELVDPAVAVLAREMVNADRSSDRQSAANSILDRAGVARKTETVAVDAARQTLVERLIALRSETGDTGSAASAVVQGELANGGDRQVG